MDMIKGVRVPERVYRGVLWLVSIVFAGFIIGLGNLVIGDLPMVEEQVYTSPAEDTPAIRAVREEIRRIGDSRTAIDDKLEIQRLQLEQAQRQSGTANETFKAWIAARTATTNPAQDPEVLARTRELEQLKANERSIQQAIATLENQRAPLDQRENALRMDENRLISDAIPAQERAMFWQELRVFGLRLALTLPMLAVATWLVVKKRKSDHWPLMRGFVLAAVFVFFVELVPYLPSYGGYIRYVVGIVLTFAAGHFLIKNMRAYLANRQEIEAQAEKERRARVSHDEAFKKMAAKVCPGCDRPIATTGDAESNFCVHCGMTLFDHCHSCNTRKMAFFRFCMTCGTPAKDEVAKDSIAPAPA
ncbi:MAG: zinc ribbon domain-containing protein [Novosphingobium sp.]